LRWKNRPLEFFLPEQLIKYNCLCDFVCRHCAAHVESRRQLELVEERQLSQLYTQEWRCKTESTSNAKVYHTVHTHKRNLLTAFCSRVTYGWTGPKACRLVRLKHVFRTGCHSWCKTKCVRELKRTYSINTKTLTLNRLCADLQSGVGRLLTGEVCDVIKVSWNDGYNAVEGQWWLGENIQSDGTIQSSVTSQGAMLPFVKFLWSFVSCPPAWSFGAYTVHTGFVRWSCSVCKESALRL